MIRIQFDHPRHCCVSIPPSWLDRLLRREGQDFEAWEIRALGGEICWVTHDNRPVSRRVVAAIEREVAARGGRR